MSELTDKVYKAITRAIKNDQMVLPTLPEVALKVRETAEDPDADVATLSSVLQNDAALSARIIKVANSPLLRATKEIEDLKMAVGRLGIDYTANLATGLAMEQMFQATTDLVDNLMREIWSRSTEVAGISHVLCRHYTRLKPDQATLAGLVQKIGALPILTFAEDHSALLKKPVLTQLIDELSPALGKMILETWDFPEEIRNVPEESMHFDREVSAPDYADIVMVAHLQSYIGSDHPLTQMDWSGVSAFKRLGLEPDFNSHEVEDLSEDMEAAMAALN